MQIELSATCSKQPLKENNPHLSEKGFSSFFYWHLLCLTFLSRTRSAARHKVLCSLKALAAHKEVLVQCKNCLFAFTKASPQQYMLLELPLVPQV